MTGEGALYDERLAREGRKWGDHLAVEAAHEVNAWIDHPSIQAHYAQRGLIDGLPWRRWVVGHLGGPAARSMELGCGSGSLSLQLYSLGSTRHIEGFDASPERIAEAEKRRRQAKAPGAFRVEDANRLKLEPGAYDLIVSSHSFHHFQELEHVMVEVLAALAPGGLFILEEFVGPTQFQWTDEQIVLTRELMVNIPESYRTLRWGAIKPYEGRPTVADVVAGSPFESIRSAEIGPLFERYFEILHRRNLGGTIQHLLYNGIAHNFPPGDPEADAILRRVWEREDALIDSGKLPSDFQLLVGQRPGDAARRARGVVAGQGASTPALEELGARVTDLETALEQVRAILRNDGTPPPPPRHLQVRAVGGFVPGFIESGFSICEDLNSVLGVAGKRFQDFDRILDWGCGSGRTSRAVKTLSPGCDLHGIDIDAEAIRWLRRYYARFGTFQVAPHRPPTPFEDGFFDFVFGISVFTHLPEDMQFEWLAELRRITKPGGYLVMTTSGENNYRNLAPALVDRIRNKGFLFLDGGYGQSIDLPDFYQNSFHTPEYVRAEWARYFEVLDIQPAALQTQLDTVLLRRTAERPAPTA
jgi:SAM-dependent methyltransferase